MNKKFLFFKLSDHLDDELEVLTLSQLELSALIGDVKPIDNIFQLMQQPEIKRVVEKDVSLQNALTDALANHGRHGYLWIGTELPDVMKGLQRLAFVKEVYLFQQLLDPEPEFLRNGEEGIPSAVFNIYLWRVYRIWTRQFLMERAAYIRSNAPNEVEIDRFFNELTKSARSAEINRKQDDLLHHPLTSSAMFSQDNRPYARHHDAKWIRALINYTVPRDEREIFLPFCGNGRWVMEALLANQHVTGADINPLVLRIAESNAYNFSCSLPELAQAISDVISSVKMIINETETPQTDLFLFGTESKFIQFWKTEKERFKTLQYALPDEHMMKYVAATRFLIESEAVSRSDAVNTFLMTGLINLMVTTLRKKREIAFIDEYQKRLRRIYLNCYALRKINMFYNLPAGKVRIQFGDLNTMPDRQASLVLVDLPVRTSKSGFEKDRIPIEIMNLHGASKTLESRLFGSRTVDETEKKKREDEWEEKQGIYPFLNMEALNFLQRLVIADRAEDAIRFFMLWSQYHALLHAVNEFLSEGDKMCIVAEHPVYKNEETFSEVPLGSILSDMTENDEKLQFSKPDMYTRMHHHSTFGNEQRISILIMEKKQSG